MSTQCSLIQNSRYFHPFNFPQVEINQARDEVSFVPNAFYYVILNMEDDLYQCPASKTNSKEYVHADLEWN